MFFRITPDKIMFNDKKVVDSKLSKYWLTTITAANITQKLKLSGKAKQSRCFKNIRSLPVDDKNNPRVWMTSKLFEKKIEQRNNKILKQKKKMLLF